MKKQCVTCKNGKARKETETHTALVEPLHSATLLEKTVLQGCRAPHTGNSRKWQQAAFELQNLMGNQQNCMKFETMRPNSDRKHNTYTLQPRAPKGILQEPKQNLKQNPPRVTIWTVDRSPERGAKTHAPYK